MGICTNNNRLSYYRPFRLLQRTHFHAAAIQMKINRSSIIFSRIFDITGMRRATKFVWRRRHFDLQWNKDRRLVFQTSLRHRQFLQSVCQIPPSTCIFFMRSGIAVSAYFIRLGLVSENCELRGNMMRKPPCPSGRHRVDTDTGAERICNQNIRFARQQIWDAHDNRALIGQNPPP